MTTKTIANATQTVEQKVSQLEQRVAQLTTEQTNKNTELVALRSQLAELDEAYSVAQRRYDLEGDDAAATEMDELRTQQAEVQKQILALQQQLGEYPARLQAIRHELDELNYRGDVAGLIEKRQAAANAATAFQEAIVAALAAYDTAKAAIQACNTEYERLSYVAQRNQRSMPAGRPSITWLPQPVGEWFTMASRREAAMKQFTEMRQRFEAVA